MLILPIKKKWFNMIKSGEKKEEYREIKPYWTRRFEKIYFSKRLTPEKIHSLKRYTTLPAEIMFRNGYRRDSPYIRCFCSLTVGQGKEEWGAEKRKRVLCIRNIGGAKWKLK